LAAWQIRKSTAATATEGISVQQVHHDDGFYAAWWDYNDLGYTESLIRDVAQKSRAPQLTGGKAVDLAAPFERLRRSGKRSSTPRRRECRRRCIF
jgi:hypothetical protein